MTILDHLQQHGWVATDGAAIATKTYPTAVGPREAWVYLSGQLLTATYWSEGRNATASAATVLSDGPRQQGLIAKFCADVDALVCQTYAAALRSH